MTSAATIAISLGMNDSVISLICVAACRIDTTRPTTSAASSSGADNISMTYNACCPMVITLCGVMGSDLVRGDKRADQQVPAVRKDEQHQLERQRDQHRRQHHHPHRHQHAR